MGYVLRYTLFRILCFILWSFIYGILCTSCLKMCYFYDLFMCVHIFCSVYLKSSFWILLSIDFKKTLNWIEMNYFFCNKLLTNIIKSVCSSKSIIMKSDINNIFFSLHRNLQQCLPINFTKMDMCWLFLHSKHLSQEH